MAEPKVDRQRASALLAVAGLDAVVVASPVNTRYVTGHASWVINLYQRSGYGGGVMPGDPLAGIGVLLPDIEAVTFLRGGAPRDTTLHTFPWWIAYAEVEQGRVDHDPFAALAAASIGHPPERSGLVDRRAATSALARLVAAMGYARAHLGLELAFTATDVMTWLRDDLPGVTWADGAGALAALRAVKSPNEQGNLRDATALTEVGIRAAFAAARPGVTVRELALRYQTAILNDARILERSLDVGALRFGARGGPGALDPAAAASYRLAPGDLLFVDAGVEVNGYRADMGCTAVIGRASTAQRTIWEALKRGQDAARATLRPGVPATAVYHAARQAVVDAGLMSHVRGNLGHGIGLDAAPELPIIAADSLDTLAPGMVLSIELPYYIQGVGGFQVEHTYAITGSGAEQWTTLPETLTEL